MSFEKRAAMPLDYQWVSYPGSALRFRGPAADLSAPHVLCIGGAETFGRFIPAPFPAQLAVRLGVPVANMGVTNAGLDVALGDPAIAAAESNAQAIVLQLPGAQNMSNPFYTVHPRRNDRFVRARRMLRHLYPDVDFTEFHFTRHLLSHLETLSRERFAILRDELQAAWRRRVLTYLAGAPAPVHLLWLSRHAPDAPEPETGLGADPLLVTEEMLDDVAHRAASLSVVTDPAGRGRNATRGMFHSRREEAAARMLPGPQAHEAACAALMGRVGPG
jgi:hypothetical protein